MANENTEQLIDIVGIDALIATQQPISMLLIMTSLFITGLLLLVIYSYLHSDRHKLNLLIKQLNEGTLSVKQAAEHAYALPCIKNFCTKHTEFHQQLQFYRFSKEVAEPRQFIQFLTSFKN